MVSSVAGGAAIADTTSGEVAALRQKKLEAIDNLRNAIIPFLALAAKSVTEAAVMLAPISGTKVLHSRKDAKRKREVMIQSNSSNNGGGGGGGGSNNNNLSNKRPALQMISHFVQSADVDIEELKSKAYSKARKTVTTSTKQGQRLQQQQQVAPTISLPRPQNGRTMYTKSEAITIIQGYEKNKCGRGRLVAEMVERGYVPSKSTLYVLLKKYEGGEAIVNEEWGRSGRPPVVNGRKKLKEGGEERGNDVGVGINVVGDAISTTVQDQVAASASAALGVEDGGEVGKQPAAAAEQFLLDTVPHSITTLFPKQKKKKETKRRRPKQVKPPPILNLPLPQNGTMYTKIEAVAVLSQYPKSSRERGQAFKAVVELGYVPQSKTALYTLMKRAEEGRHPIANDLEWNEVGRPKQLDDSEVDAIVSRIENEGHVYGTQDVRNVLVEAARRKAILRGGDPDAAAGKVTKTTVSNYATLIASRVYERSLAK
jgi:hypothetical protein